MSHPAVSHAGFVPQLITSSDRIAAAARDAVGDETAPGPSPNAVDPRWPLLHGELSPDDTASGGGPGRFSFIEYNSGAGVLSMNVATQFPEVCMCVCVARNARLFTRVGCATLQATVISIEGSTTLSDAHLASALRRNVSNNAVCRKSVDEQLLRKFWESPEFVRFQVLSGNLVDLLREHGISSLQVRDCPRRDGGCPFHSRGVRWQRWSYVVGVHGVDSRRCVRVGVSVVTLTGHVGQHGWGGHDDVCGSAVCTACIVGVHDLFLGIPQPRRGPTTSGHRANSRACVPVSLLV